uniref:Inositol-tetrakisphosphate 1-kinase n=1 Tax=Oryza meridionalis TaxID=40149 RepID=A0A0E0CK76_9ORYZ
MAPELSSPSSSSPRYTVGYALLPEKVSSVVRPSLVAMAADRGVRLVAVDVSRPLAEQGPFDLLVHKMYDRGWRAQLEELAARHPGVPVVVDSPAAIDRLLDRATMLDVVSGLRAPVSVPPQVVVSAAAAAADSADELLARAALRFPLIAKPLAVDGCAESHDMRLVYRRDGVLPLLRAPLVLQEFVNHGGVLFKVYVVGDRATCVRRSSLPDVPAHRLLDLDAEPSVPFANISNQPLPTPDDGAADDDTPAAGFVDEVARGLRRGLGLHLFNFDMIRERSEEHGDRYFIIDINYFPGYAKMPGYEAALTDFFLEMLRGTGPVHEQLGPGSGLDMEARKLEPGLGIGLRELESGRAQA